MAKQPKRVKTPAMPNLDDDDPGFFGALFADEAESPSAEVLRKHREADAETKRQRDAEYARLAKSDWVQGGLKGLLSKPAGGRAP